MLQKCIIFKDFYMTFLCVFAINVRPLRPVRSVLIKCSTASILHFLGKYKFKEMISLLLTLKRFGEFGEL